MRSKALIVCAYCKEFTHFTETSCVVPVVGASFSSCLLTGVINEYNESRHELFCLSIIISSNDTKWWWSPLTSILGLSKMHPGTCITLK